MGSAIRVISVCVAMEHYQFTNLGSVPDGIRVCVCVVSEIQPAKPVSEIIFDNTKLLNHPLMNRFVF